MADDPLWINADTGAPAYAANELRRAMATLLSQSGEADRFGAREGVHPAGSAGVTISGMTITVQHLKAVVYPGLTTLSGPYIVQLQSGTHAVTAADATNPRKDIVALQIQDHDEDSSGQRRAQSVYVAGTPAPSPVEPALPSNSFRLATVDVPAGSSTPTLTYNAPLTVAVGGIVPVRTDSELPGGSSGLYDGAARWNQALNELQIHNGGSTWETVGQRLLIPSVFATRSTAEAFGTTELTVVSAPAITGNGSTPVKVSFSFWGFSAPGDANVALRLKRGSTVIGSIAADVSTPNVKAGGSFFAVDTPPSGSQTYSLAAIRGSGASGTEIQATSTRPMVLTVEQFRP
jgi:hypothetical protein